MIENLNDLIGHLGWSVNDVRKTLFNPLLRSFYLLIYLLSNRVVVTEEIFKDRLQKIVGKSNKIITISHGVDTKIPLISQNEAKRTLKISINKKVVLYFGYLSWYKGADLFFKFANKMGNDNVQFIMAGGPSFTNVEKPHYQKYLKNFNKPNKNILITGFVPEEKISLYFSAADLVVLPYRTMMSSSGPLSLAFSFEKPLIMSDNMKEYTKTPDFFFAQKKLGISPSEIFFPVIEKCFKERILNYDSKSLASFSSFMKNLRSYSNISKQYYSLINE